MDTHKQADKNKERQKQSQVDTQTRTYGPTQTERRTLSDTDIPIDTKLAQTFRHIFWLEVMLKQ
jgi:adenylosuccinate synthase